MTTTSSSDADRRAALLRFAVGAIGPVAPAAATWLEWSLFARRERVIPLLYHLVDTVATDLTDDQRSDLRQRQGEVLSRCVRLEHQLLVVTGLLRASGVRSAVLKGAATAHLDYPDASWREFGDVDILVDATDMPRAAAAVEAAGWHQGYALPRGHERFTHAVTYVHEAAELDLHQQIAHRALGLRVPTRALLDHAVLYVLAGTELLALDDVDRFIHAAVHATSSRGRFRQMSSAADVLVMVHGRPHLAEDALERAEQWCVRSVVERAVRDASAAARLAAPDEWIRAMRRPIRHRDPLVDRAYLSSVRRPVVEELAYLRLLDGWRARWHYATGYLSIGPEYASQHGRSGWRAQWSYLVDKLRSSRTES